MAEGKNALICVRDAMLRDDHKGTVTLRVFGRLVYEVTDKFAQTQQYEEQASHYDWSDES